MEKLYILYKNDFFEIEDIQIYKDEIIVFELSKKYPKYFFDIFIFVKNKYIMSYDYIQNGKYIKRSSS